MIVPRDELQQKAKTLAVIIKIEKPTIIITRPILIEIGDSLSKVRYRKEAAVFLEAIENDPKIEIIPLSEINYKQAFELFNNRTDKNWGLTDCFSFVVMKKLKIKYVLTVDKNFEQTGFNVILLK